MPIHVHGYEIQINGMQKNGLFANNPTHVYDNSNIMIVFLFDKYIKDNNATRDANYHFALQIQASQTFI